MAPALRDVQVEQPAPGTAVAVFEGEHDFVTREAVEALLGSLAQANDLVIADFSRAYFVDAAILGVLRNADRAAKDRGGTFRVQLGTAHIVRRAFEVSGLLDVLDVAATREQALERRAQ
jgi:anti-anti-sigma factor